MQVILLIDWHQVIALATETSSKMALTLCQKCVEVFSQNSHNCV